MRLIRDNYQNFKTYQLPKAQLIIADVPYNLGNNAYASNPAWYLDGDNKNGESELAGKQFFDTDINFKIKEMKTIEEKAKECIDNLIDTLSLEVNHEEDNYDAGQVHALSDYGKEIYKVGFLEGQSNPKIKQLEWDGKEELAFFTAKTNLGEYMIDSPHHDGTFMLMYTPDWSYESFLLHTSNSTDELKSFAQRDFEQRVKECLITE